MKKHQEEELQKKDLKENQDAEYSNEMMDIEYRDAVARAKAASQRVNAENI